jgi:hypothetical protein
MEAMLGNEGACPTRPAPGLKWPSEVLLENDLGGLLWFLPPPGEDYQ